MDMSQDWGVVGHEWAVALLQRGLKQGELAQAYLFTGPPRVGKMTLAMALARTLLCQEQGAKPCGECQPCRLASSGSHPDLHVVEPGTSTGRLGIDQIRDLTRQLSLTPSLGQYRVAIISDFEQATPSAANALLKTLEEPPPYVVLILLAPDADSLLPTIVSRCQIVSLRPISAGRLEQVLGERWGVEPEQAKLLAHLCGGRLGWAVQAVADATPLKLRGQRLEELFKLLEDPLHRRFKYAEKLAKSADDAQQALDIWAVWWRDVMLVAAGADGLLTNVDMMRHLREHAQALGVEGAVKMVKATRTAADLLDSNTNARQVLEVLLAFDLPRL